MKRIYQVMTIISAVVVTAVAIPQAQACSDYKTVQGRLLFSPLPPIALPALDMPATVDSSGSPSITGMWSIQFISKGNTQHNPPIPDGAVLDFGFGHWHPDTTEFFNSGGRAPSTQNFCMGVWRQTGAGSYQLNHFAYSYDATSGVLGNSVDIKELLTLDASGNSYSGTFSINVYDLNGNQVDKVTGTIAAARLTVNSPVPPVPQP